MVVVVVAGDPTMGAAFGIRRTVVASDHSTTEQYWELLTRDAVAIMFAAIGITAEATIDADVDDVANVFTSFFFIAPRRGPCCRRSSPPPMPRGGGTFTGGIIPRVIVVGRTGVEDIV